MYQPCGLDPALDPITAAFFSRSKADTLLKVDLVPHWPTTIQNSFDIPDTIDDQTGDIIAPGQAVLLHEVQDRDNVFLLVNNDNDNREVIPADPSSNYPDDRFESSGDPVLKNQTGKRDDDAVMVRIAFPGAENIDSGTLELRLGSTAGSIDSRVVIYHAAGRDSDGVLLTAGQLSLDLANPDASNPLEPLADGEEVKVFIEGVFALGHRSCLDQNLMVNQSEDPCSSNPDAEIGPYVTETQKDGFVNNYSWTPGGE